jgi:preprotein translocase subunit SecG
MSVRQVWREAAALFWEYPVLWAPVLGADLLLFFLTKLQQYVSHVLIYHLVLGPASVFGGTRNLPGPSSNGVVFKAAVLSGTLQWSTHFAQIIFYTIALFITAALVRKSSRQNTELLLSPMHFVRSRRRAIFGLSLRVLGLVVLLAIFLGTLIAFTISQAQKYMVHLPTGALYVLIVPAFCSIAYLAAPITLRHIGLTTLKAVTAESKRKARIFAVLAVAMSSLLGYCLPYIEGSFTAEPFFSSLPAVTTLEAIVSLLVALPYVVLFIALTLIVEGDAGVREPVEDSGGLDDPEDVLSPS